MFQSNSQSNVNLIEFKTFAKRKNFQSDSILRIPDLVVNDNKVNYLAPLFSLYGNKKALLINKGSYFDRLSQTVSFMGDWESLLEVLQKIWSS